MTFLVPQGPDYQWYYSNTLTTRPVTTGFGTAITPGAAPNFGNWTQVASAANISQDVYGVLINFNNGATSATIRNILCDMGVDNAGGTAYLTKIPYLIAGSASTYGLGSSGIWYFFPIYFKSGSSVAFRALSTTVQTAFNVNVTFLGQPRRMEAVRTGGYVDAFGFNTTTAAGTTVTPGTTAEGNWAQLGTATTKSYWWWQCGYASSDTTQTSAILHADLGAGTATTKKILFENQVWQTTAAEQISCNMNIANGYNNVATGSLIYGRLQHSGTADAGPTMIAYGLGG